MSFSTEKEKQASERFMLVRLSGLVDVTSQVVNDTGRVIYTFTKRPLGVVVTVFDPAVADGPPEPKAYTEVFSLPVAANQYYINDATSELSIYKTNYSTYCVEFPEYFTGSETRFAPSDPTVPGTNVEWKPLLESYPGASSSIADLTVGVFSISDTTLEIFNEGNWLGQYTKVGASLLNQKVVVWQCINDVSNVKRFFTGSTASVSSVDGVVSITALDKFNALNKRATFGLKNLRTYANPLTDQTPPLSPVMDFSPTALGKAIPRHFQKRSTYNFGLNVGTVGDGAQFYEGLYYSKFVLFVGTIQAYICGRSGVPSGSGSIPTQSFGSITSVSTPGFLLKQFNVTSHANLYYNQTVTWTEAATTYHGVIASIPNSTSFIVFTGSPASTSSTFTPRKAFSCYMREGNDTINLIQGRDYTLYDDGQSVRIVMVSGFTSNFSQFTSRPYDPYADKLYYYYYSGADLGHATVLKQMVEASGLATNAASFATAASELTANVCLTIPFNGTGDIGPYSDYVSRILESTGGYLRINAADEVEYHLFKKPSATLEIRNDEYSNMSMEVEYQDIYPIIEATNSHFKDYQLTTSSQEGSEPKITAYDEAGLAINGPKTKYLQHGLESMTNSMPRVLKLNSIRRNKFRFTAPQRFLDVLLGDDIRIYYDKLPGGASYIDAKIVSKSTDGKAVDLEAVDLPNL